MQCSSSPLPPSPFQASPPDGELSLPSLANPQNVFMLRKIVLTNSGGRWICSKLNSYMVHTYEYLVSSHVCISYIESDPACDISCVVLGARPYHVTSMQVLTTVSMQVFPITSFESVVCVCTRKS